MSRAERTMLFFFLGGIAMQTATTAMGKIGILLAVIVIIGHIWAQPPASRGKS